MHYLNLTFKIKNIKELIISFAFLMLPYFAFAQTPSVTFVSNPVAGAEVEGDGSYTGFLYGSVQLAGGATINEVEVIVYSSTQPINPSSYTTTTGTALSQLWILGSQGDFTSSNGFYISLGGLQPGQTYYFLVETHLSSAVDYFDQRSVSFTVPGTLNPDGDQTNPTGNDPTNPAGGDGGTGGLGGGDAGGGGATEGWPQDVIQNTLEVNDLNNFVVGLLNALLKIGIPILTVFLVYSGLRLVMARGNEKELADAKKNLLWVIIGGAVLLGAWTIVKVLKGTFDQIDLAFINSLINLV